MTTRYRLMCPIPEHGLQSVRWVNEKDECGLSCGCRRTTRLLHKSRENAVSIEDVLKNTEAARELFPAIHERTS